MGQEGIGDPHDVGGPQTPQDNDDDSEYVVGGSGPNESVTHLGNN